jgi:hypothetical protein
MEAQVTQMLLQQGIMHVIKSMQQQQRPATEPWRMSPANPDDDNIPRRFPLNPTSDSENDVAHLIQQAQAQRRGVAINMPLVALVIGVVMALLMPRVIGALRDVVTSGGSLLRVLLPLVPVGFLALTLMYDAQLAERRALRYEQQAHARLTANNDYTTSSSSTLLPQPIVLQLTNGMLAPPPPFVALATTPNPTLEQAEQQQPPVSPPPATPPPTSDS